MTEPTPGSAGPAPFRNEPLVAELQALRRRTGLSMAALAAKTAYSKSSWERYLNGRAKPPRAAVEALCRTAGEPPQRLIALWQLTAHPEPSVPRAAQPPGPAPPDDLETPAGGSTRRRARWTTGMALAVAALLAGIGFAVWPGTRPAPTTARCHAESCDDRSPASTLCATTSHTLTTFRARTGQEVDIRYSDRCGAVWARLGKSRPGDRIQVIIADSRPKTTRVRDQLDADGYVYTPMAAAGPGTAIRACVSVATHAPQCVSALVRGGL
ncbi:helix-turn-helix domain-containing protein [Streptomyces sp. NPDC056682]|uniref:helix-turn-helix domain-containing protein n=1 Tax=Streptomyces sp. NPDC056682 TaxID=3345909 RepID=UPI0036C5B47A